MSRPTREADRRRVQPADGQVDVAQGHRQVGDVVRSHLAQPHAAGGGPGGPPCKLLDDTIDRGAQEALRRRGGSVLRVVESGRIAVGDSV